MDIGPTVENFETALTNVSDSWHSNGLSHNPIFARRLLHAWHTSYPCSCPTMNMANCKPDSYTWGFEQRPGFIFVRNYVITRISLFTIPQVGLLYLNHTHINERRVTVRSQQVNFNAVQIGLGCVNINSRFMYVIKTSTYERRG